MVETVASKHGTINGLFNIERTMAAIPMVRIAQPAEVAEPCCFLLSDAASYITGQHLNVGGSQIGFRAPPNVNLLQQVRDGRQPFGLGFPALWGDPGSFARQLLVDVREHQGGDAGTRGSVAIAIDGRDERAQAA